jgi:hypothetical protein
VRRALLFALAVSATTSGCIVKKFVYRPVPVANAIGDSTTTLAGTKYHVYRSDQYELYGPTAVSVAASSTQLNRTYREFAKHFGFGGPMMAVVLADSAFLLSPNDAGIFAQRALHTFVYVRPHNLKDVEGVAPDAREEEIWPVAGRSARELLAAYVDLRQHKTPEVETSAHGADYHISPLTNWFVAGVVALLSDPGAPERSIDYFLERMDEAPTAAELLDMRPSAQVVPDSEPHRERRMLMSGSGVALTLFLVDREGPRIVSRIADAYLAGRTARDALQDAKQLPRNEEDLQRSWRAWVRDTYGR